MNLFEYEAKQEFSTYSIPIPQGTLVTNSNQTAQAIAKLKPPYMIKAQVLVGGRGKAGGIISAKSAKEAETADYVAKEHYPKPVVAYVAGRFAPSGKRMGHAGAIIMGKQGTAQSKIEAFTNAGVQVAEKPGAVAALLAEKLLP